MQPRHPAMIRRSVYKCDIDSQRQIQNKITCVYTPAVYHSKQDQEKDNNNQDPLVSAEVFYQLRYYRKS